jgi:hypothetical protein
MFGRCSDESDPARAAWCGRWGGVKRVRRGQASGWTPLHRAAAGGHSEVMVLLIDARADVLAEDKVRDGP